eukprot:16431693-Heterocapsa_arctica.AAC.1
MTPAAAAAAAATAARARRPFQQRFSLQAGGEGDTSVVAVGLEDGQGFRCLFRNPTRGAGVDEEGIPGASMGLLAPALACVPLAAFVIFCACRAADWGAHGLGA